MKLEITHEDKSIELVALKKGTIIIGRSKDADLQIKGEGISRQHLKLELADDGKVYLTDLGSVNGCTIDNKRVPADQRIEFSSFFPVTIGKNVSIALASTEEIAVTSSRIDAKAIREAQHSQRDREKHSDSPFSPSGSRIKTSSSNKDTQNTLVLLLAVGLVSYGIYYFFIREEDAPAPYPVTEAQALKPVATLVPVKDTQSDATLRDLLRSMISKEKCATEFEKKICKYVRGTDVRSGVHLEGDTLYLFFDYAGQLRYNTIQSANAQGRPELQTQVVHGSLLFNRDAKRHLQSNAGVRFYVSVGFDKSNGSILSAMKIQTQGLYLYKPLDYYAALNAIIAEGDTKLFNKMIAPMIVRTDLF